MYISMKYIGRDSNQYEYMYVCEFSHKTLHFKAGNSQTKIQRKNKSN